MNAAGSGYLRFPTISGETVVFVCEDDLWSVSAAGGRAERLTAANAEVWHPRLSGDGHKLAFVGQQEGPEEVYVMPAAGGPARRLTYNGANCTVVGWHDDAIIYESNAGSPFQRDFRLWRIDPEEGLPRQLRFGSARSVSYGPGGAVVLGRHNGGNIVSGRHNREPASAKRYRGGRAGTLWVDARGSGDFVELSNLEGNLADPCWIEERIYFLSDYQGIGNVYSCFSDGTDVRRHTDHERFYARNLTSDGHRLVYHCAGDVYLLDPAEDTPQRLEIDLPAPRPGRDRRFVPAAEHLGSVTLGPDGSDLALTSRGKAFSFAHWEGPVRQHGEPDGVRYRLLTWLNDHQRLVAVAGGEQADEHLVVLPSDGRSAETTLEHLDIGRAVELAVNPHGDLIAIANHRHEIVLIDLESDPAQQRLLDHTDAFARPGDLAWSPDGRWLAYSLPEKPRSAAIIVSNVVTGERKPVTHPVLSDSKPAWDPGGKYLYFLGQREFDPVYDALQFDAGFPLGNRPYMVTLRADTGSPFIPKPRPVSANAHEAETGGQETETASAVEIDLDGIERRVVAMPLPVARYRRIAGLTGKVLLSSVPLEGSLGSTPLDTGAPANGVLESFDLDTQRTERISDGMTDFTVDADAATMLIRAGKRVRVLPAGAKPATEGRNGPEAGDADKPGRSSGWIDLDRVKVSVRPGAEWRQMFRDAWRLQRDHFWDENMSGVPWHEMYQRYLPLVDRIATRAELSDLLWEFHAELGTSHAYEMGGHYPERAHYHQGHLGADFAYDAAAGRFLINAITTGDPADDESTSPLMRPGIDVRPGDEVLAVNGQPIGAVEGASALRVPGEPLVNQAGREVELTVAREGVHPWTVAVKASADERPARYRDWVEANRGYVRAATGGRVGYLHIPNMGPQGFAEFHRSFLVEYEQDALVVDVRFNGGGNVSPLLLEKLGRLRTGQVISRWSAPMPTPPESPRGPLVAVTNENAGSDGDIFSHRFQLLGYGPLVGKRSWGGVVGIAPRASLADGTVTTQPEFYMTYTDVGWGLENRGAEPDVEVDISPQDYADGVDPQLDRAIELALGALDEHQPHEPVQADRPQLTPPPLAARPQDGGGSG